MTLTADTMPPLPLRDVGAVGSHSAVSDSDAIQEFAQGGVASMIPLCQRIE